MTIRLAVIGCGYITQASHGPAYLRLVAESPGLVLAACCDSNPARADAVREKFGFSRAYTDDAQMLAAEPLDAVCLNVPVGLTAQMSASILKARIPLLAEKPPALTVEALDPLIQLASQTGVLHQVAFNRRFAPLVQVLKGWLEGQAIVHVDQTFSRVSRTDSDFSTTAIHGIDTLRYLVGSDFRTLRLDYRELVIGPASATVFVVDGAFQSGAGVHLLFQPVSGRPAERTHVYTRDHTYELSLNLGNDAPGWLRHWHKGELVRELSAAEVCGSSEDYVVSGFYAENAAFLNAVQTGIAPLEHGFVSARQSVAIMQAMRERRPEFTESAAAPL